MIPAVTDAGLQASAPVILLGRGGSGTRLLSDLALLDSVFLGNWLNASQDSVEWLEVLHPLALEAIAGVAPGSGRDAFWRVRITQQAAGSTWRERRRFRPPATGWSRCGRSAEGCQRRLDTVRQVRQRRLR